MGNDLVALGLIDRLEQGGVFLNDEKVASAALQISAEELKTGVKLRKGKKVFHKAVLA